jgi:hypothetical protein
LPFFVVGGVQFLLFIAAWIFFPKTEPSDFADKPEAFSVCGLFKNVKFSLTLLVLFCGAVSINFVEPSIQLHLLPVINLRYINKNKMVINNFFKKARLITFSTWSSFLHSSIHLRDSYTIDWSHVQKSK